MASTIITTSRITPLAGLLLASGIGIAPGRRPDPAANSNARIHQARAL